MDEHDRIAQPRIDPSKTPFIATASFRRYGPTFDPDSNSPEALYTKAVIHEQGFDTLPHVVTRQELDGYIAAGEIELYRGITEWRFADQLRFGEFFVGRGGELDGMYAAAGPHALAVARQYAAFGDGTVIRMTLKQGARIIGWHDLEMRAAAEQTAMTTMPPDAARSLYNDHSRLAVYLGYDAVRIVDFPDVDQFVVLNRTALRVQKEDLR